MTDDGAEALMEAWSRPGDQFYPGGDSSLELLEEGVGAGLLVRSFWTSYFDGTCSDEDLSSEESRRVIDALGWRDPSGEGDPRAKHEDDECGCTVWFPEDPGEGDHMVPMYVSTPAMDELAMDRCLSLPVDLTGADAHAEHLRDADPDAWLIITSLTAEVRRLRDIAQTATNRGEDS